MLIECPSCHARAKIPDSKERAKVRCGECGRIYVALAPGSRSKRSSGGGSGAIIGISAAAVALLLIVFFYNRTKGDDGPREVVAEEREDAGLVDHSGWDSELVQLAVKIHMAAHGFDPSRVKMLLHGPRLWAEEQAALTPEGQEAPDEGEFVLMAADEKQAFLDTFAIDMIEGKGKDLVADWKPYNGLVLDESDYDAIVRLEVQPWEPGSIEKRWVQWHLARENGRWKAYRWERWISPDEQKVARKKRSKGFEVVTLSDGSVVLEREAEPLGHLPDTPQELRDRIDSLYATMIDLDLTTEAADARTELTQIGRPAIPILLTGLYETPLDSMDQAIQVNMMVIALRDITGKGFGYKPQAAIGSGTGTSEERRQSAIKQWFAWWYRNQDKFEEKVVVDGLAEFIELTDKEKRDLERFKND
ncbi:MAG: hypothetical protein O7B99_00805 [Planctomycetota bacterium]|nr:hypothetical protein [Planctomycetota bacterium]